MIPSPWAAVLLVFAAYRLTRLAGWDEWPPIANIRAWVIGERWTVETVSAISLGAFVEHGAYVDAEGVTRAGTPPWAQDDEPVELPGKQPTSEAEGVRPAYDRPLLAHLVHCPFCLGWWVSVTVWAAWLAVPHWATVAAVPLAISGVVGLVSKNLDP